jgi:1-aminocyclopropane-1-carboxylate deaminase
MQGCKEIVDEIAIDFDYIISAVGTGCTIAGIASALKDDQKAIGVSVLKGAAYLKDEIDSLLKKDKSGANANMIAERIILNHDYHFGGYAKIQEELITFINDFYKEQGIKTDPIYSGKSLYALFDMIKKDVFKPGSTLVYYHCGGLQGVKGMEDRYHIKLFDKP